MKKFVMYYNREKFIVYYTNNVFGEFNIHRIVHSKTKQEVGEGWTDYKEIWDRARMKMEKGK